MPIYYNHLNTGRPVEVGEPKFRKYCSNYFEVRNDPLYPFGYGLSYTTVEYGKPSLNGNTLSVTVKNTGYRATDEVVQFYIRDLVATIMRPVKELKGFERVHLEAGESKTVSFTVTKEMLSYYDGEGNTVFEPGDFDLMVGPNSRDVQTVIFKEFKELQGVTRSSRH